MSNEKIEDWDFDFSMYEEEEKEQEMLESIKKAKKPRITNLKSKYSPSLMELESISNIKIKVSEKAIQVASFSQDIKDLWDLFGCLNEYWARIHDIFGSVVINEIKSWEKFIFKKLIKAQKSDSIPYTTHKALLNYRDKIYMLAQRTNLGLEVDRAGRGARSKAAKGMIE